MSTEAWWVLYLMCAFLLALIAVGAIAIMGTKKTEGDDQEQLEYLAKYNLRGKK